ncbi:MAG: hypothetical protein DME84_10650, partial [Verrucomicrobia bacterium]
MRLRIYARSTYLETRLANHSISAEDQRTLKHSGGCSVRGLNAPISGRAISFARYGLVVVVVVVSSCLTT